MPSCQPFKAFNHLFFCVYFLQSPYIYLFIYRKSFGFYVSLKNESMSFFFLDALGDVGEYLKKKYIGRGMKKVFKELKAQEKE